MNSLLKKNLLTIPYYVIKTILLNIPYVLLTLTLLKFTLNFHTTRMCQDITHAFTPSHSQTHNA